LSNVKALNLLNSIVIFLPVCTGISKGKLKAELEKQPGFPPGNKPGPVMGVFCFLFI
jgi:hypothetical protein